MTSRNFYTPEEDDVIRRMAGKHTIYQIAKANGRGYESTRKRMLFLGINQVSRRLWTTQKDNLLKRYIDKESREELARRLGVTKGSVIGRIKRLGLTGITAEAPKAYRPDEDAFLRANVGSMTQSDMARVLKRDPSSVSCRLKKLGIRPVRTVVTYAVPKARKAPEIVPLTARPWLTRTNQECKYLYGARHAYLACCQPVWMETGYCETHAALCGGYRKKVAA